MAHFASVDWPAGYGYVVGLLNKSLSRTATTTGSTEGTDMLTASSPGAGLYQISVYAVVDVASTANTSDVFSPILTWTDSDGAHDSIAFFNNTTTLDATATAGTREMWTEVISVASGDIVIEALSTISGTGDGTVVWSASIERIG